MKVMLKHKQNPPLAMTAEVKVSQRYLRSLQKKTQVSNTTAPWPFSGTNQVSRYQKCKSNQEGKSSLDSLDVEIVSGSGISCAICKSAPYNKQITTPESYHSVFTDRMPFLPPNQQYQFVQFINMHQAHKNTITHNIFKQLKTHVWSLLTTSGL